MQTQIVKGVATKVFEDNGDTVVTYHGTEVVRFNQLLVFLNTGGWKTATTKLRMNQASNQFDLGFQVFQSKHEWYVQIKGRGKFSFSRDRINFLR